MFKTIEMNIRKYISWNTMKGDSWTPYYLNVLPCLHIGYDKNSFGFLDLADGEYIKEIRISFDFLIFSFNWYLSWNKHQGLL